MSGPSSAPRGEHAPAPASTRDTRIHFVSGVYIPCCEEGETDCPCICHDSPPNNTPRSSAA